MASIFKKALSVFVEFEPETQSPSNPGKPIPAPVHNSNVSNPATTGSNINRQDLEKFEKHFDGLFEKTNQAGPDYYEFFKMMETLEAHIPDEKARISAVFASLSIQGMTKNKLLETAAHYKSAVEADREQFQKASEKKASGELDGRRQNMTSLEKKIADNSELIKNLTKEITEAQSKIAALKEEIKQEEYKLATAKNGYTIASDAILNKINSDILKINTSL